MTVSQHRDANGEGTMTQYNGTMINKPIVLKVYEYATHSYSPGLVVIHILEADGINMIRTTSNESNPIFDLSKILTTFQAA